MASEARRGLGELHIGAYHGYNAQILTNFLCRHVLTPNECAAGHAYLSPPLEPSPPNIVTVQPHGVVVVVGLQELHLLWYGLEHGSDPRSPLWCHRLVVFSGGGFRLSGRLGDGRRSG